MGYGRSGGVVLPSLCSARTVGVLWASTSSAFQCGRARIARGAVLHRETSRSCLFILAPRGDNLNHDLSALPFDIPQPPVRSRASVSLIHPPATPRGLAVSVPLGRCAFDLYASACGWVRAFVRQNRHTGVLFATPRSRRVKFPSDDVPMGIPPVFGLIHYFHGVFGGFASI